MTKIDPSKIKIIRECGKLPPFDWPEGEPAYLKFEGPLKGIKIDNKPATRGVVLDLETNTTHSLLAQTVLVSTLLDNYPNDSYVGKSFMIKRSKQADKDYYEFELKEIQL